MLFNHCKKIKEVKSNHHIYGRPEEVVTPPQTTLLKLVDSYLESTQRDPTTSHTPEILKIHESLGSFLIKRFISLSSYSQRSISRALGTQPTTTKRSSPSETMESASIHSEPLLSASSTSTVFPLPPLAELDARLPKVCEALVLITQCIVTISLEAEDQKMLFQEGRSTVTNSKNMKEYFNEKKSSDQGIVESLIGLYCFSQRKKNITMNLPYSYFFFFFWLTDLLRQFDLFLPRINFGKLVNPDGSPSRSQDTDGFFYLKRDLVRLLGVLCHGVRAVQDRTRVAGGLPVVMNLCVIDERNPCESSSFSLFFSFHFSHSPPPTENFLI